MSMSKAAPTTTLFALQSQETVNRRVANRNLSNQGRFIVTAYDIFNKNGAITPGFKSVVKIDLLQKIKNYCEENSIQYIDGDAFDNLVLQKYTEFDTDN